MKCEHAESARYMQHNSRVKQYVPPESGAFGPHRKEVYGGVDVDVGYGDW
jgi:hypothetical protein